MFDGEAGPFWMTQLADGAWVDKDPKVYAKEWAEYEASLQPKPLPWTLVLVLGTLALFELVAYILWG